MTDAIPHLPEDYPTTRKALVEKFTTGHLRSKMRRPYQADEMIYATNGHALVRCPATDAMQEMNFHDEENWENWQSDFEEKLGADSSEAESIDLRPVLETLHRLRTVDNHEYHTCSQCGNNVEGRIIGQKYAPAAIVYWRGEFWNPGILTRSVAGAVATEETMTATAYPVGEWSNLSEASPLVLDVGEVRLGIMMMAPREPDAYELYPVN
jgi:hypothetical protein